MDYICYMLLWFFFLYAFIGWVVATVFAAIRERRFIDVGFLYGPICPAYGIGAAAFAVALTEMKETPFFLFLGGAVLGFLITHTTGFILEKIFHRKWWDYSRKRFQFGGTVNLPYTVLWGAAAVVCIYVMNPLLARLIGMVPLGAGKIVLTVAGVVTALDFAGTVTGITAVRQRIRGMSLVEEVSENLQKTADTLGGKIADSVQRHLERAYPGLSENNLVEAGKQKAREREAAKETEGIFAFGCSFYKLVWLFFIGAFLGDLTETIFCYVVGGELMSRSSVVYGPFSIVWGLGCVLLTAILYQYRNHSDRYIFLFGTVVGGAYEYVCSLFTEIVFGTVFWDYSGIPFNLGGRINLLYCFFWGIAAVVWIKMLYPVLSKWIERIPKKKGTILTWIFIVLMAVNILISVMALGRYSERNSKKEDAGQNVKAESTVEMFLDEHFPDERMERIYPNIIIL